MKWFWRLYILGVILLVLFVLSGCVTNPCVTSPGSLACLKQTDSRDEYWRVQKRCHAWWKATEDELPVGTKMYYGCGDEHRCCDALAREAMKRVLR